MPAQHVCAICLEPLSLSVNTDSGETTYLHGVEPSGHLVVPIPRAENFEHDIKPVCDFCMTTSDRESSWLYPTERFQIEDDSGKLLNLDDGEGWGACAKCHALIEVDNFNALAARAASIMDRRNPERGYDACEQVVGMAHSTFRQARNGSPCRAVDYKPHL